MNLITYYSVFSLSDNDASAVYRSPTDCPTIRSLTIGRLLTIAPKRHAIHKIDPLGR